MNILKELELMKTNYSKSIELVSGLKFSQKDLIRTIEFYNNSKYLNGQKDELGRDKPFMQILNSICDVENSAKDLDTSDIQITSDDSNHFLQSFLLTKDLYVWMKESNFAKTINDMRDMHTRYGSLLVKKCIEKEEDGKKKLEIDLPEWKNVITDQVDIIDGSIIETHYMTASDIYEKRDVWKRTSEVLKILSSGGSGKRIPVYEIRGFYPRSWIKELDGDNVKKTSSDFSYQLYYIAGVPQDSGKTDTFDALIPLYWEDDTEKVYKYLARKPRAGRGFGVGVMEEGEEAQVWTNDAVLKQYRAMEYTTKVIGQSASKKLKGRNLLNEVDDGTILDNDDKPITRVDLLPAGGLQQYDNLINQWYSQLEKTTSAYAAQRGDSPNSGTPFRLQATVLQQSSSVFKTLQEEFGIFLTEIIQDWVLPFLVSQLSKEHILAYDFSPEELKEIDSKFAIFNANQEVKNRILEGKLITQEDYQKFIDGYDEFIKQTKGKRFIQIPEGFYNNLSLKVTVNITGEQRNKAVTLESLNNLLITYSSNPNLSTDPVASQLLAKIVELSGAGISPISISAAMSSKNKQAEAMQEQLQTLKPNPSQPTKMDMGNNPNMPM